MFTPAVGPVLEALDAESEDLERLLLTIAPPDWDRPTPAEGWTIRHQIGHLADTDSIALAAVAAASGPLKMVTATVTSPRQVSQIAGMALAISRPALRAAARRRSPDLDAIVDAAAGRWAGTRPDVLLARWHQGRIKLAEALAAVPPGRKVPWIGPPMSPASMGVARIMETWAHGLDVADTMGVRREPTERLRYVAHIGVISRKFAFRTHQRPVPEAAVRVELEAPNGTTWTWGPDDAPESLTGPAEDFCLLVTQRRHPDDLRLKARGQGARDWLQVAQAFAGPPGSGRPPS